MNGIELQAVIGDKRIKVVLSKPFGAGGHYHINVDGYYHGVIIQRQGEWVALVHETSWMTGDDLSILIEIVKDNEGPA